PATAPTATLPGPTTTVVDPDGFGPLPPTTVTVVTVTPTSPQSPPVGPPSGPLPPPPTTTQIPPG
ncbi:MAG: hypothetical protein IRZ17_22335, partial [Mycolicibacterium hassiacum]|nr:hypothetical protein [Mycolicibacterium hassiacum]